ncbi:hypothetical protein EUGRSUZ_H00923 [Eucalyptus grandis]|uniref:Uncharacterized protein n=2 Tax=Eucalyptus grandis TaxID=71139 RepID=A0ACC3KC97_EUCGR|nr:hypothetical protein EUGRSUZ_H00923 [Eucalyptus grandis]
MRQDSRFRYKHLYKQKEKKRKKKKSRRKLKTIHGGELLRGSNVRPFCRGRMDKGLPEHPRQGETSSPSAARRPLFLLAITRILSHLFLLHLLLVKLPHHVHLREAHARLINPRARHSFPFLLNPKGLDFCGS